MRLVSILVLLVGLFSVLAVSAGAQEAGQAYQVPDVAVDITVDQPAQARDTALAQAQSKAFEILAGRFASTERKIPAPPAQELAGMVSSFEMQKEHVAGKRYMGTFSIQFDPAKVRTYLESHNVHYQEAAPIKVLILPVTNEEHREILWEEVTPWRAAWFERSHQNGLLTIILPEGDLQDVALIGASDASLSDLGKVNELARKYTVDAIISAIYPAKDSKGRDAVMLVRADKDGTRHEAVWVDASTEKEDKKIKDEKDKKDSTAAPISLPALVAASVRAVEDQHAATTRPKNPLLGQPVGAGEPSLPAASGQLLSVQVPSPTLADWARTQRKLSAVTSLSRIQVKSMARGLVTVELETQTPVVELQPELAKQGLYLALIGNGGWELRAAENAEPSSHQQ